MFDVIIYSDETPDSFTAYMIAKYGICENQDDCKGKTYKDPECINYMIATQEDIEDKNVLLLAETKLDLSKASSVLFFNSKKDRLLSEMVWNHFSNKELPRIVKHLNNDFKESMNIMLGAILRGVFEDEGTWGCAYEYCDDYNRDFIDDCEQVGRSLLISYSRILVNKTFMYDGKEYSAGILQGIIPDIQDVLLKALTVDEGYDVCVNIQHDFGNNQWEIILGSKLEYLHGGKIICDTWKNVTDFFKKE